MNSNFKSNGFSLIEVLISLVILSISLLALASLMTTTTKNNAFGGNLTEAATLAQDTMENLRVTNWGEIVDGNDVIQMRGLNYNRDWTVVAPNNNERRVTVTVNWNDGVARSISFLTVITR
jgi:type IV pilus assembly protein PilV